jgi:DNA polymerase III alpha subunit
LGYYISGHPLAPFTELINLFTTHRGNEDEKNNNKEVQAIGVVTEITKKRDSKGNSMAFIEMEDQNGRFELTLFNKNFEKYAAQFEHGKVYFVIGERSQYNMGDDKTFKLIPRKILSFEAMPYTLKGDVLIEMNEKNVTSELLDQLKRMENQTAGHFSLHVLVHTDNFNTLSLQAQAFTFFPDVDFITWCKHNKIELKTVLSNDF